MDAKSCGICCGAFSTFAFFFLIIVGSILNNSNEQVIPISTTQQSGAASACFAGAGLYAGCVGISSICYFYNRLKLMVKGNKDLDSLREMSKNQQYQQELV